MTREELYGLVWSEPMVHVAKRLGLSDRGLAKRCKTLNVPVPPRGYWARLQAGRNAPRTPLPGDWSESENSQQMPAPGPAVAAPSVKPAERKAPTTSPRSCASDAEYQLALSESAVFERHSRLLAYVDAVLAASGTLGPAGADHVCQWASSIRERSTVDDPARQRAALLARRGG